MRTNEENLDLFADLMAPVAEIMTDEEVVSAFRAEGGRAIDAVKPAIKNHKKAIIEILAALEGVDVESYVVPPPAQLLMKIVNLANDPDVQCLFSLQGQTEVAASSGSATENTTENDKDGE